ncbi:MAG: trimethylamine methyltransferase family protein [Methanobacteriota archaeon]|nr:MAG: trimethylamine methyltransferase family protein [Euryarchaeota archaeon]
MMKGATRRFRIDILSNKQLDSIHEATLTLLERTGIRFDSKEAIKRLVANGAILRPESKNTILFPRSIVEDAIDRIQHRHEFHARNPANTIKWNGKNVFAGSGGGSPEIIDIKTGTTRPSTLEDVAQMTRLLDALDRCHMVSCQVMATDVHPKHMILKTTEAMIKNTSKCLTGYALDKGTTDALAKMWSSVVGGSEVLRKKKHFAIYGSPSSPLTYDSSVCEVMMRSAHHGIPFDLVPCPMCGGTAPVTLAGGLVQQNAEVLAGLILLQTVDAGLPMLYSGRLSLMDPRTGKNLWGVPEMPLVSAASVQIAHRYNMVADVEVVTSDVQGWDTQMGLERMMTAVAAAVSGADSLAGIGSAWETSSSMEMAVIDDEILAYVFRLLEGIDVDESSLAIDIVDAVGPMGNFLAQRHTIEYLRKGAISLSSLFDKRTEERAMREGFLPLQDRAKETVKRILSKHEPVPLDKDVEKELARIVKESCRELG